MTIASLTAAAGVLTVNQRTRNLVRVTLTGPVQDSRRVLIEIAKPEGGPVADGFPKPTEETASACRFAAGLQAGEVKHVTIAIDREDRQTIAILDDKDAVAAVLSLGGASDAARASLERITGLRAQEATRVAERDALVARKEIVDNR